jgi:hypothetical protein
MRILWSLRVLPADGRTVFLPNDDSELRYVSRALQNKTKIHFEFGATKGTCHFESSHSFHAVREFKFSSEKHNPENKIFVT